MGNRLDVLFLHAIVITMQGNGVGIIEDGAEEKSATAQ